MSTDLVMLMLEAGMAWAGNIAYHQRSKNVFRQILCSGALRLALRTTSTVHLSDTSSTMRSELATIVIIFK